MLLFDLSFTAPRSMANPQAAATSFVKNSVLPRDRVAVATLDLEHGFKLLTAFTSDRELVAMAIRNPSGFRSGDPLQLSNEVQVASRDTGGAALADMLETKNGGKLNDGAGPGDSVNPVKTANLRAESEHSETINRDIAHSNTAYLRARVEKQVGYLGELARTLRGVSGHKQIVFLSEGFDSSVIIGRDARASEATKKENDDLTRGTTMQKAGQCHALKVKLVKVPGTPPVSARTGYWEASSVSNEERTLTTAEIILNDIPQDGLKVDAFTVAFPTATDDAQVPVVLELAGGEIVGGAHSNKPPLEFYLYAFDENGEVRDRIFQRATLDLTKLKDRLFDAGVKFVATLSLPPGTYAIRSLVRMPESDRKGFARTDLVVPARGTTAMLAPVFIEANASWVTIKGASHTQAPYPFHLDSTEFVPAATARIPSGETPQFAVFVQNASPADVTIDTIPRAKFIGAAHGEGTSAFLMQLDDLPASVATIDVTLHRKGATDVQKTSVRVEP